MRDSIQYRQLFERFGLALAYYYEVDDELDGLETLMLISYKLMKYIRDTISPITSRIGTIPSLYEAISDCIEVMDNNDLLPLFKQADALEAVSRAAYKILGQSGIIKAALDKKINTAPHRPYPDDDAIDNYIEEMKSSVWNEAGEYLGYDG